MTKILKKVKENLFVVIIILGYVAMFIIKPQMGISAKNSGYYIKEMLLIMPVIFVLTALLDTWVPKQTIVKYLGHESRAKGVILSFVLRAYRQTQSTLLFHFVYCFIKNPHQLKNCNNFKLDKEKYHVCRYI